MEILIFAYADFIKAKGFTMSFDPIKFKGDLEKPIVKLSIPKTLVVNSCAVEGR